MAVGSAGPGPAHQAPGLAAAAGDLGQPGHAPRMNRLLQSEPAPRGFDKPAEASVADLLARRPGAQPGRGHQPPPGILPQAQITLPVDSRRVDEAPADIV